MDGKLGEILSKNKVIDADQLKKALELQFKLGGQLGDILQSTLHMPGTDYAKALAEHFNIPYVNLESSNIDLSLLLDNNRSTYFDNMAIPIRLHDDAYVVAVSEPSLEKFKYIESKWGPKTIIVCASKLDILGALQKKFRSNYLDEAVNDLARHSGLYSSKYLFNNWQILFIIFFILGGFTLLYRNPMQFLVVLNSLLTLSLSGILFYRIVLVGIGISLERKQIKTKPEHHISNDLPNYSILIPLYKEKAITLRNLFHHIKRLNYPKHKLDVKILVEEDDLSTIAILKQMSLPRSYEYIYIPAGEPRTKSKACNYGLKFVYGEYVTLYDAEDLPDANQLLDALEVFKHDDEKLACVQCRLNFYNPNENWITRMFTLEYSTWFDLLLPALRYTNAPIPLGGTSNHFRTSILKGINSWDPYNVTEDADLGIRLFALGYKTTVISSVTYEEANCQLINWLKQRTRWIKGYMQTYIVHMRKPLLTLKSLGFTGFLGFQLFLGGVVFSDMSYILVTIIFGLCVIPSALDINLLFPSYIKDIAIFNFVVGTFGMIVINFMTGFYRKNAWMMIISLTSPLYWLLMSLASYRALYQLLFHPSYWDKTEHGLSSIIHPELKDDE